MIDSSLCTTQEMLPFQVWENRSTSTVPLTVREKLEVITADGEKTGYIGLKNYMNTGLDYYMNHTSWVHFQEIMCIKFIIVLW